MSRIFRILFFTLSSAGLFQIQPLSAEPILQAAADRSQPLGHFKVRRPANLDANKAETIYQAIREKLSSSYGLNRSKKLRKYLDWSRYSRAPYRSATHGARYVNNYANPKAKAYGQFEQAGVLAVGSTLVKDSFSATARGDILPGPLFVMEKMPQGFNSPSVNWKYTMIMPDGSLFGTTKGEGAKNVAFCVGCHATQAERDHLFFIPKKYRRQSFEIK